MLKNGPKYETTDVVLPACELPAVIMTPRDLPLPRIIMHTIAVFDVQSVASHRVYPILEARVNIDRLNPDP